jgi:hypothetical protein
MIVKRIPSKSKVPRFARLAKYVVAAQGQLDPRSWTRTADYILDSGVSSRGEKVGGVRVTNCHTDDPAAATTLIETTQAANTRSTTDKTYHMVFSFPPGEEPDLKILHAIEDELCRAIGYADHQRISAVHIDTDHLHVHVAINKVHPTGYQNIEPYYDKKKLMETCERLELEYGLTRTNHGLTGERKHEKNHKKLLKDHREHNGSHSNQTHDGTRPNKWSESSKNAPTGKAADIEAHSGVETLTGYVSREVAPAMRIAANWQQLHAALAEHGLEIKKRGAGLVIGHADLWVRASQCDRSFSLKSLTDRLGPFKQHRAKKVSKPYEPKPRQQHPSSAALFAQYQKQARDHKAIRRYGYDQVKYESALLEANLQKWKLAQRLLVKIAAKGPTRRAMLKMVRLQTAATRSANRRTIDAKRKRMISDTAMPSWIQWLSHQAENGNIEALNILRSRQEREAMQGDYMTAGNTGKPVIADMLRPQIDRNGIATYRAMDGGLVIDRSDHVQCFKTTKGSAQLALDLASKRFTGQPLIVEGQDQFKKDVARLAGIYNINVRFADPAMEQARQAAIPDKYKTNIKSQDKEAEL